MKNLISWIEIPATNFEKAVDFYSKTFNMQLQIVNGEQEKMACFPGGEGAISMAPGFKPSKDGVLVSFNTGKEMSAILDNVKENGGEIVQPKTKIEAEGRGHFAIIIDCEGNKIGLYED